MPKFIADLDGTSAVRAKNFLDPSSAQDLATKNYVDSVVNGLEPKAAVVAIATSNVALSGTQTIDGVSVSAGQRVLLTGQSTASQNGIWVVASGAWTRPTDFASGATATAGAYVLAEAGTAYQGHGFILTGTGTITIDTTSQTWQEFTGASDLAVTSPLQKSGNTLSLGTVPVGSGGTGGTTAAQAKTNLGFATSSAGNIGDGSTNPWTYTHNLGTKDVICQLKRVSDDAVVNADIVEATTNTVTIATAAAMATNAYRITVIAAP